jgi:hypothetical protein
LRDANGRAARNACIQYYGSDYSAGGTKDCDEYPFRSTYQGVATVDGSTARSFSVRPITLNDNRTAGSRLGTWYTDDNILDGDPFWVKIET